MLPIAPLSYDVISQIAQGYEGVDADIEIFKKNLLNVTETLTAKL